MASLSLLSKSFMVLMLAVQQAMNYNRGHKGRRIMAVFGGRRLTRTGLLFVIGIIVLGGLVTGGIFLVKNHGEVVRRDQAVKIAETNLKDQSKAPTATQPVNGGTADKDQTNKAGTGASSAPSADTGTNTNPNTNTNTNTASSSDTSALPVTGPDDLLIFGRTIIVAILAFSVVSYVASRRAADRL
jgi:hypothetical protein